MVEVSTSRFCPSRSCYTTPEIRREVTVVLGPPIISTSIAPTGSNVILSDSSFFKHHSSLPSFEEVRRQARSKPHPKKDNVAIFDDLNLLVKFGINESIAEGQCLYTVRRILGSSVPVPEVYAWCEEGREAFVFMELIDGLTLETRWDDISAEERHSVAQELHGILHALRQAKQDPEDQFVGMSYQSFSASVPIHLISSGHICRTPLRDHAFPVDVLPNAGPFLSVKEFHDWFAFLPRRDIKNPNAYPIEPYRTDLPDDAQIVLTHGDLHRSNIMVTKTGPPKVLALIDWYQAGWLPEYWEVCKAEWTVGWEGDWAKEYIPQFLQNCEETEMEWDFYVAATGN